MALRIYPPSAPTSSAYHVILGDLNTSYSSCGRSQPTIRTNCVKVCGDLLDSNKSVTNHSNWHVWAWLVGKALYTRVAALVAKHEQHGKSKVEEKFVVQVAQPQEKGSSSATQEKKPKSNRKKK